MTDNINIVHKKLFNVIDANFTKILKLKGVVNDIDDNGKFLTIKTLDTERTLKCRTKDNFTKVDIGDVVDVVGNLQLDSNDLSSIYLDLKYLSKQSTFDPSKALTIHNKLLVYLNEHEKVSKVVKKIHKKSLPKQIYNIALIAFPTGINLVNTFKTEFKNKCVGNLYTFYMDTDKTDVSIVSALEYFRKYRNIDIICLLTDQLNIMETCKLSSKEIAKVFLSRKNCPYILSIVSDLSEKNPEPITALLSNKKIETTLAAVNFISEVQWEYRQKVDRTIDLVKEKFYVHMDKKIKKLQQYEVLIWNLNKTSPPINSTDNLKNLLRTKMTEELDRLNSIETELVNNIILSDPIQKIVNNIDMFDSNIFMKIVDSIIDKMKNDKAQDKSLATTVKENALRQNLAFQSGQVDINKSRILQDTLVEEMKDRITQDPYLNYKERDENDIVDP